MIFLPSSYNITLVFPRVVGVSLRNIATCIHSIINWVRSPLFAASIILDETRKVISRDDPVVSPSNLNLGNRVTCPYEYILQVYGRNHFAKFVDTLNPDLKLQDTVLYGLTLEVMDAIHFGAILVDDIADRSLLRKGRPAAHCLYGSSETINRAYLRILEAVLRCLAERPSLVPYILTNLTQIHSGGYPFPPRCCIPDSDSLGQDISLVWRRDGFENCPDRESALKTYRNSAYLKTGALFRLVGQLVSGNHENDAIMSQVGCALYFNSRQTTPADFEQLVLPFAE